MPHRSPDSHRFTLIELLVVVAIIAVLASLLLPTLAQARHMARRVACISNTKQLHLGFQMYVEEFDGKYPNKYIGNPGGGWPNYQDPSHGTPAVDRYMPTGNVRLCPGNGQIFGNPTALRPPTQGTPYTGTYHLLAGGYAVGVSGSKPPSLYNGPLAETAIRDPARYGVWSDRVFIDETDSATYRQYFGPNNNHQPGWFAVLGGNYVFADGHARWLRLDSPMTTNLTTWKNGELNGFYKKQGIPIGHTWADPWGSVVYNHDAANPVVDLARMRP